MKVKSQTARLIFDQTTLYHERKCITCGIIRKPRASHCKVCNNCVKGYDHHCTLLNNCIGVRNIRAFMALLISAWLFFILSTVFGFCALTNSYLDPTFWAKTFVFDFDLSVTCAILSLQLIKIIIL